MTGYFTRAMDPRTDNTKNIQAAWQAAQEQVADLRAQVEHLAAVANAKVQQNLYERELDRAFRDLGEAVWAQVSKGKLQLPSTLSNVMKALAAVTSKIQEQNRSINDLLAEGAEIATRLQNKKVAPKGNKR